MDPNDVIDTIVDAIDYAEIAHDNQGLIKARRLLNNDLRQAIDFYVQQELLKALAGHTLYTAAAEEFDEQERAEPCRSYRISYGNTRAIPG